MKYNELLIQDQQYTLQGMLLGFLPVTLLSANAFNPLLPSWVLLILSLLITFFMISAVWLMLTRPATGRLLAVTGTLLNTFTLWFDLITDPLLALFYAIVTAAWLYYLFTAELFPAGKLTEKLKLSRLYGSAIALVALIVISPLFAYAFPVFPYCCLISIAMMLFLLGDYWHSRNFSDCRKKFIFFMVLAVSITLAVSIAISTVLAAIITAIPAVIYAHRKKHANLEYLQLIIQHPARCLMLTFLAVCAAGTLLLRTPFAMQSELSIIDAAFTAVSATCVTGLTTIDINTSLTFTGQMILLLLIQLGGLGIMTLATLALHALGKLSLNQEQLATVINSAPEQNIFQSMRLIVRFTFAVEAIGAFLLTWGFYVIDGNFWQALKMGVFTSVSAFCNAGLFLGSQNLVPYAGESLLLLIVATEIILGGIAPAVSYTILKKRSGKTMPPICKLVLSTTAFLLLTGTFSLLLFEWNGVLNDFSLWDKLVNAFFQSATLRTAGFSSVNISAIGMPSYMLILILMFIGGSPGGTAGGIKTTTAAVLYHVFRTALHNEEHVVIYQRRISSQTIIHAVAVTIAAVVILFAVVLVLTATQTLPTDDLLFEAVSALGTVGVSLGITDKLDSVGRIIIIIAMFIGRIGPLTLFMLLQERRLAKQPGYPQINIPLG